ncbi:hypothetical protein N9284_01720 [Halieaceae bacterium]|nr:hypothetical protein [Halieaceae bacterium]
MADALQVMGTAAKGAYWFSRNPDRAWAEKFFLIFIPIFFAYNAVIQQMACS